MGLNDARIERVRRQIDDHRIDLSEPPQRHPFIRHAVLTADYRNIAAGGGPKIVHCGHTMLRFHGQDDNVVFIE